MSLSPEVSATLGHLIAARAETLFRAPGEGRLPGSSFVSVPRKTNSLRFTIIPNYDLFARIDMPLRVDDPRILWRNSKTLAPMIFTPSDSRLWRRNTPIGEIKAADLDAVFGLPPGTLGPRG
jgi:hypothetical protein